MYIAFSSTFSMLLSVYSMFAEVRWLPRNCTDLFNFLCLSLRSPTVTFSASTNFLAVIFAVADFNYVTCALQFIIGNSSQLKLFKHAHTHTDTHTNIHTHIHTHTHTHRNSLMEKHAGARSHLIWKSQNVS